MPTLSWPAEVAEKQQKIEPWLQPGSNICLDLHGNPAEADLVIFSDGNHHMALRESINAFVDLHGGSPKVFYLTTPPGVLLQTLKDGAIRLANLVVPVVPHFFAGPPGILDKVVESGRMQSHFPFMESCGNALLVKKGNPKGIENAQDLMRPEIKLFLSNPENEKASYSLYRNSLEKLLTGLDMPWNSIESNLVFGERIHHREAPQALADNQADVAILYHHLARYYVEIFPEHFELVTLEDTAFKNNKSKIHIGVIGEGGRWGKALLYFFLSGQVEKIYGSFGLKKLQDKTLVTCNL
jgi:hypothetical protein